MSVRDVEREQQRQAELEELKKPKVTEFCRTELRRLCADLPQQGRTQAPLQVETLLALLDEIDRLETRWQRMATSGPLGVLRRQLPRLEVLVQHRGLNLIAQGHEIERLKLERDLAVARADAAERARESAEMRAAAAEQARDGAMILVGRAARLEDLFCPELLARTTDLDQERTNHEVTRERLAAARGEGGAQ